MCGIAGFFLTKINKRFDSEKVAYSMATSLEHRGPDKRRYGLIMIGKCFFPLVGFRF